MELHDCEAQVHAPPQSLDRHRKKRKAWVRKLHLYIHAIDISANPAWNSSNYSGLLICWLCLLLSRAIWWCQSSKPGNSL